MALADTAELAAYREMLLASQAAVLERGQPVVERGCYNIKRDAASAAAGHRHLPHYGASITYDVKVAGPVITGEVGPDKRRRQGALGNIAEYGTGRHGPALPVLGPAFEAEVPRFLDAVADMVVEVLAP
jgi:hypothetical protein